MTERLKQFYKDHEETIFFTSVAVTGALVAGLIMRKNFNQALVKAIDGGVVTTVEPLMRGDGVPVVLAHARNGRTFYFAHDQ